MASTAHGGTGGTGRRTGPVTRASASVGTEERSGPPPRRDTSSPTVQGTTNPAAVAPERVLSPEVIDALRRKLEDAPVFWACKVCGPHKGSRGTWCEAGCGSDYQEMRALYDLTQLDAHRLVVLIDLARELVTAEAIRAYKERR